MTCNASIIVCAKNRGYQLDDCLGSLLAMDATDYEIVVVDDASTDDTPAILERIQTAHPHSTVRVVTNSVSRGMSAARNAGIDACRGRYILFVDSDCTVHPDWLTSFLTVFEDPQVWAAAGCVIEPLTRNLAEKAFGGTSVVGQPNQQHRALVGCNMGFRGDVVAHLRFDETITFFCEEDDIARRIKAAGGRLSYAPGAVLEHRHPQTLSSYLGRAYKHGRGSARFWYKHSIYLGPDVVLLTAALVTLPLGLLSRWMLWVSAACAALHLAALLYNEVAYKGKSVMRALSVLPLVAVYSVLKCMGTYVGLSRIALGIDRPMIESKRRWRDERRTPWRPGGTPKAAT